MSKKLPRCGHCRRRFRPDVYNAHHQQCCTRAECVLDRKRKRQREWYAARRARDAGFCRRERARCAKANGRRRAAARPGMVGGEARRDPVVLSDVVTGLLSQMVDSTDPAHLQRSMRDYAARGRRLALATRTGTDPP